MTLRVVGLGQRAAGDDGVGLFVLDHLRTLNLPKNIELLCTSDPTELIYLFESGDPVVIVDAVVGEASVGTVQVLDPEALHLADVTPVSSHGLSLDQVIRMSRELSPGALNPRIKIVGVHIAPPEKLGRGLSLAARRGVEEAARCVQILIQEASCV